MPFDAQQKHAPKDLLKLGKEKLFCAACSHWITAKDWQISIKDGHEHTVFNPAGLVFHIGCFRDAPGCWATGQPSADFTWFPGYRWRLALCEGCGKQLGWLYTADRSIPAFYGLILNRLKDKA